MNNDIVVAKRYAKALFEVAQEQNTVSQVEEELKVMVELIQGDRELDAFLNHPNVESDVKNDVLQKTLEGKMSAPVLNTLKLMVSRKRIGILPVLLHDFVDIANEKLGMANAVVHTPFALNPEQEKDLIDYFAKLTGKTIRLETVLDSSLIGGVTVQIGDRVYDGSLKGKLDRLQKSLKQAQSL